MEKRHETHSRTHSQPEFNSKFLKEGEKTLVIVAVRLLHEFVRRVEVDSVELHGLWFVCDVKKKQIMSIISIMINSQRLYYERQHVFLLVQLFGEFDHL